MRTSPSPFLGRWDSFGQPLLRYVVAKLLQFEPSIAVPLLQVNSTFNRAAAKILYEELYVQDDNQVITSPPRSTRHESVLRYPKYLTFVRTLVVVPAQIGCQMDQDINESCFSDHSPPVIDPIRPESLGAILETLTNLEAFVWATDRMPFRSLCSVIHRSSPRLQELLIRPTNSDLAHSQHWQASQESNHHLVNFIPQRWDAFMLLELSSLRLLSISGLSIEGVRELQKFVGKSTRLSHLTIDSQFVDDALLNQVAELKCLKKLLIKTSGTKMTDKGISAILESSETLQSLILTEVEGRLNRSFWGKVAYLPSNFRSLRVAFNEEGPHHSWVSDHLSSIFDVLEMAPQGLRTFSLTRLSPKGEMIPVTCNTQEGMVLRNGNGESGQATMIKRFFISACDEIVRPRPFPNGSFMRVVEFGARLEVLELDMFIMTVVELRNLLESCKQLRYLRILLDAPLTKVLTMSSAFVPLSFLHTFVLSITDAHCPSQALVVKTNTNGKSSNSSPNSAVNSPTKRRASEAHSLSDFSPASAQNCLAQSEPEITSPSSSPRISMGRMRNASISTTSAALQSLTMNNNNNVSTLGLTGVDDILPASVQGITGNVGSFDTSIPPKRDIRKFARRCPNLRIIRWAGRNGKGEWRIAAGSSSIHANIDFVPIHLVEDEEAEKITLASGADVEDFIIKKRKCNLNHPGKQIPIEDAEGVLTAGLVGSFEALQSTVTEKSPEITPRIDGRMFPRLKANAVPPTHEAANFSTEANGNSKRSTKVENHQNGGHHKDDAGDSPSNRTRGKPTLTFGIVTKPSTVAAAKLAPIKAKPEKSYAFISDPTTKIKNEVDKKKSEAKMTVLGESNSKKASNAVPVDQKHTSLPAKGRTVTKVRDNDDGFSGATIIIGQGKAMSTTSGAAGRRTKKKLSIQAKNDEESKATSQKTLSTRKDHHQQNSEGSRRK